MRHPGIRTAQRAIVIGAVAIGGVIAGFQVTSGGGGGGGGSASWGMSTTQPATFNVFMSPAANGGSDSDATNCARLAATTAPPGGVNKGCATATKAMQVANCGDNVGVFTPSTYNAFSVIGIGTAQKTCSGNCREDNTFQDGTTATKDLTGCVTFAPVSGTWNVCLTGAPSTNTAINIEAPYVRVMGINACLQTGPSPGPFMQIGTNTGRSSGNCSTNWDVHDVIVANSSFSWFVIHSSKYVEIENSVQGPSYYANGVGTDQISACNQVSNGVSLSQSHGDHIIFNGMRIHDIYGFPPGGHMEGIHWNDGNYGVIVNTKFQNTAQQAISVQPNCAAQCNATANTFLMANLELSPVCEFEPSGFNFTCAAVSGGGITLICDTTSQVKDVTLQYVSFDPGLGTATPSMFSTNTCSAGNVGPVTVTGSIVPRCNFSAATTVTYAYTVYGTGTCTGTGNVLDVGLAGIYTNPALPGYDYTLQPTSPALGIVTAPCQPDITGATRTSPCDAGANER